jgi:multidrug efflux system membrane fusion protein
MHEVTDYIDYTGRVDAVNAVDVRARVTGYLEKMPFKEGDEVEKGALLFLIDERPYQAQLSQAEAQVQLNEAALKLARANNARAKNLSKNPGVITQQDLDQYQATEDQSRAQLEASKAALATYRLNVEFCRVTSPIDGQVSRYYYTVGNLVNQDQTLLTTLVSLDPIYVYFDVDEITVLKIKREINEGKMKPMRETGPRPVYLGLPGEDGFPHRGNLTFINNRVDPNTGTLTARGVFPNPRPEHGSRLLTPGMFARVRLPMGQPHQAVLVAERALGVDQGAKFLYVVNADNKVEYRRVKTGALQPDGMRVIEEGVKPDEWVIVSGLQLARPNATVSPDKTTMQAILKGIGAGATNSERASAASGGTSHVAEPSPDRDQSPAPEDRASDRPTPARKSKTSSSAAGQD